MKIRELLSDKSKWTQKVAARNLKGRPVPVFSKKAAKWCVIGAMHKCYKDDKFGKSLRKLNNYLIKSKFPGSVFDWNDSSKRKFEDIKTVIEKIDI